MNHKVLFNKVLGMYPAVIDLAGATIHEKGGATIPKLIEAHDHVEETITVEGNEHAAMDWAVFQTLHAKAKSIILSGGAELSVASITYADVSKNYELNLESIREGNGEAT